MGSKALILMSTLGGGRWPVRLIRATGWLVFIPIPALTDTLSCLCRSLYGHVYAPLRLKACTACMQAQPGNRHCATDPFGRVVSNCIRLTLTMQ